FIRVRQLRAVIGVPLSIDRPVRRPEGQPLLIANSLCAVEFGNARHGNVTVVAAGTSSQDEDAEGVHQRVASTLRRSAEVLEHSAALAEEHAAREERAGRAADARKERRVAERARSAARRARSRASEYPPGGPR